MNTEFTKQLLKVIQGDFRGDFSAFLHYAKEQYEQSVYTARQNVPPENSKIILSAKNVCKSYSIGKESVQAVKDISFEIVEGEIVSLVGVSGSGKSTLLNLIGGLDTPDSGEIYVDKTALHTQNDFQLSKYRNEIIGFIFQFFNLQPYLNVLENVEIPLIFRGENTAKIKAAAVEAIKAVGLSDRIAHLPDQLSGGQMQRVAIARALVNKPKIILADEPTGNLDRQTGMEILELLRSINQEFKTTIIMVTHDSFVASKADRIFTMADGKLL